VTDNYPERCRGPGVQEAPGEFASLSRNPSWHTYVNVHNDFPGGDSGQINDDSSGNPRPTGTGGAASGSCVPMLLNVTVSRTLTSVDVCPPAQGISGPMAARNR
jgi:hypothetical protein